MKFSGILDCRSISTIGDVTEAADSLQLYECFPGVTCSRELGGYVVENGIMEFPRKVWPYLDYHGIGKNTMRPTTALIQSPVLWCGKRKRRRWKRTCSGGSRYSREGGKALRIFCKKEKTGRMGSGCGFPATKEEAEQVRRSLEEQHSSIMLPFIGAVDSKISGTGISVWWGNSLSRIKTWTVSTSWQKGWKV